MASPPPTCCWWGGWWMMVWGGGQGSGGGLGVRDDKAERVCHSFSPHPSQKPAPPHRPPHCRPPAGRASRAGPADGAGSQGACVWWGERACVCVVGRKQQCASSPPPQPQVVPSSATLAIALVDTSVPLSASAGIPLTAVARAFQPPAPRGGRGPPVGGWRTLSAPAPAFEFDLTAPPADGETTTIQMTATAAGVVTGVLAWPELNHGGGEGGAWRGAAPDSPSSCPSLRPVFHPFAKPMQVAAGDVVSVFASHNTVSSRFSPSPSAGPPRWTPGLPSWHAAALADGVRNPAYGRAIRAAVKRATARAAARAAAGDDGRVVVVDAGGSAGLFAALAATAGAHDVIVTEPLPAVADLARDLVAGAGVADRVTVLRAPATALTAGGAPPLRPLGADIVVVDAFDAGLLGWDAASTLPSIVARVGAPGVEVVPRAATLWCCGAALSLSPPPSSPFTSLTPLDAFWWRAGSPTAVDVASLPLLPLTAPARVWAGAFDGGEGDPPATPLRGGGVPITLDVIAEGALNAVIVWFDLDMGGGEVVMTIEWGGKREKRERGDGTNTPKTDHPPPLPHTQPPPSSTPPPPPPTGARGCRRWTGGRASPRVTARAWSRARRRTLLGLARPRSQASAFRCELVVVVVPPPPPPSRGGPPAPPGRRPGAAAIQSKIRTWLAPATPTCCWWSWHSGRRVAGGRRWRGSCCRWCSTLGLCALTRPPLLLPSNAPP